MHLQNGSLHSLAVKLGLATVACLFTACGTERASSPVVVRDSVIVTAPDATSAEAVGETPTPQDSVRVTIVENGSLEGLPEAFVISATPLLDLGGRRGDPNQELDPGAPWLDAVKLSDGRYVVSDNHMLKVFDAEGRFLSSIGRPGRGPGEFGQVRGVCVTDGDTIVAIQYNGARLSVFDVNGTHVRTLNLNASYLEGTCLGDGSLLVHAGRRANPESSLPPEQAEKMDPVNTVRRVSSDGRELGTVGTFPAESYHFVIWPYPNVVAAGDLIYTGFGRAPEVRVHHQNGGLVRIIRWDEPIRPFSFEEFERETRAKARNVPVAQVDAVLNQFRARARPATLPLYNRIEVDSRGRLWVQDHGFGPQGELPWTVFDASGKVLGRVALPRIPGANANLMDIASIGDDQMLIVWRDEELGFPHLTLHEIRQATSQ